MISDHACNLYLSIIIVSLLQKRREREILMPTKRFSLAIILFLMFALVPMPNVSADVGPKPRMDFTFTRESNRTLLTITSGTLFECKQADCGDAVPLQELGPQRFSCGATSCSAMAYGFSPYHRLLISFLDGKIRQSNVFKTDQFQSSYLVTVRENDLVVKARLSLNLFSPLTYILLCASCLILIAILVIAIILLVKRSKKK